MGAPKGNSNAAKENRLWGDTLRRIIAQDSTKRLHKAAETLLTKASNGDLRAIEILGDRVDGRPHQSIDATLDGTLTVNIKRFS